MGPIATIYPQHTNELRKEGSDMNMVLYMVNKIKEAEDENGTGADIYRALFVDIIAYERYRTEVNSCLMVDGYSQCIVNE